MNFRGSGYRIYLTYIISNIGPGDLNNGVAVLVRHKGQDYAFTAEYAEHSLDAKPGHFGHRAGRSTLKREHGIYRAKVRIGDLEIDLDLRPDNSTGFVSTDIPVLDDDSSFLRAGVPVLYARASGRLVYKDHEADLQGVGGMEFLSTNTSPHSYVRQMKFVRTYSGGDGFFLGQFKGTPNFPGDELTLYAIFENGRIRRFGHATEVRDLKFAVDPFSGFPVPVLTEYRLSGEPNCEMTEERLRFAGGFFVLGHISPLLRWVIQLLFARPHILHYDSRMSIRCETSGEATERSFATQSSYYVVDE